MLANLKHNNLHTSNPVRSLIMAHLSLSDDAVDSIKLPGNRSALTRTLSKIGVNSASFSLRCRQKRQIVSKSDGVIMSIEDAVLLLLAAGGGVDSRIFTHFTELSANWIPVFLFGRFAETLGFYIDAVIGVVYISCDGACRTIVVFCLFIGCSSARSCKVKSMLSHKSILCID